MKSRVPLRVLAVLAALAALAGTACAGRPDGTWIGSNVGVTIDSSAPPSH